MNDATPDAKQDHSIQLEVVQEASQPDVVAVVKPVVNGVHDIYANEMDMHVEIDESDARHEPAVEKTMDVDDAQLVEQKDIPAAPNCLPVTNGDSAHIDDAAPTSPHPPVNGDVPHINGVDGIDVPMDEDTKPEVPQDELITNGTSPVPVITNGDSYSVDGPPPAKRARVYSDADKASITHSPTPPPPSVTVSNGDMSLPDSSTPLPNDATPTPTTPAVEASPASESFQTNGHTVEDFSSPYSPSSTSIFTPNQHKFCVSTIRNLKKLKTALPFLHPVDPIALGIPHYYSIIKSPMDLNTIERKLLASNPIKADPNPANPKYRNAEEFVADVRLVFSNCYTFNGADHDVSAAGKRTEEVFDKQIKHLPPAIEKAPTPVPMPTPSKKTQARRVSTATNPIIKRLEGEAAARPKRDVHPPPPKDLPYDQPKKKVKTRRARHDGTAEQLKYCSKILSELYKKGNYAIASAFYEPVDWVTLQIPTYPQIVKHPMDMRTMRQKLENGDYVDADGFYQDFKLMIRNCFAFNPKENPVAQQGDALQKLFDEKWAGMPPLHGGSPRRPESEDESEEDETDDDRAREIARMEKQLESIQGNLLALKSKPKKPKPKPKEKPAYASTSKLPAKHSTKSANPKSNGKSSKKSKRTGAEEDFLSFEQKKDLSEAIGKLDGAKLEKVIQIIHEGMPEIRDSNEEIELEIDLLPAAVLTKLYNFVLRPLKSAAAAAALAAHTHGPSKRSRSGKGTGTGGLKRKSMDEDVEAEKIRQLEQRMALFEQGASGSAAPPPVTAGPTRADSESSDSSGSESSNSDSE